MTHKKVTVSVLPMKGCYERLNQQCARYYVAVTYQWLAITMTYDGNGMALHQATAYAMTIQCTIKEEHLAS